MKCKSCEKEHDGTFGFTKQFCSRACSNKRNHSSKTKQKIAASLIGHSYFQPTKTQQNHVCVKCNNSFSKTLRKGRKIVCENCKRKSVHTRTGNFTLMDLSSRTVRKILERADLGCAICNWKESSCDVHHIIPRSKGGTDDLTNLILICPNDHRLIHNNNKYELAFLQSKSFAHILPNWKDFYSPNPNDVVRQNQQILC